MSCLGCDTGGTFTDLVYNVDGRLTVAKVPTTRPDPGPGLLEGLAELGPEGSFDLAHGTTVGTNALLERKGAHCALVTTSGFADLLLLGRGIRPDLYALHPRRHPPLIPRDLCFEVRERLDAQGGVLVALEEKEMDQLVARLVELEVEAVAVCLLFSYLNTEHEEAIGERLSRAGIQTFLSSRISPEYREYERASTTALAAYLGPVMASYLGRMEREVKERGARRFWVVHSAGAVQTGAEAAAAPNTVVLSGPAAGVRGAFTVAQAAGFDQLLTLDMGGTSTDVSLCPGGPLTVAHGRLEHLPVRQLMIDIHTVGAGGGSIARVDEGGALRVGPDSAGSDPGPAAYGRGHHPTVTDAHLVLGRLPTELAGGVKLDRERAQAAIQTLADQLECGLEVAAAGILEVASTHMERALRVISIERGFDPREFVLVPFGGAGPLHAAELADKLAVRKVLIPAHPGVLSALGAAVAPWMRQFSQTVLGERRQLESVVDDLRRQAHREMGEVSTQTLVDLRYQGQGSELTLAFEEDLEHRFHQVHQDRFGYHRPECAVETVTVRVRATQLRPLPSWSADPRRAKPAQPVSIWHQGFQEGQLYERAHFQEPLPGPALILQYDTTTYVPPGWSFVSDLSGNLILEPL